MGLFNNDREHVAVDLPKEIAEEVSALLPKGADIAAVKYVREQTGLSMKPALDAVNKQKETLHLT